MSFIKVYIHFVWATKNREPFLSTKEFRVKVWNHILENARKKGIFIDFVNGYSDHCHCLVSLGLDQTVEKIMQLVKGESSFWINQQEEFKPLLNGNKFRWQEEYYAISVSESVLDKVRNYIKNQEIHHSKQSFKTECDLIIEKHGFQIFKD